METTLGLSAEDFYNEQKARRTSAVELGRRLADLTIPSVFTPEDYQSGDDLRINNQSISARAVNTLSTKLTQVALPPNLPFIKYSPKEGAMQDDIRDDPALWGRVQYALSRREQTHRERLETTAARSAYGRVIRLLLVTGNALTIWTDIDGPIVYNMHSYVVRRSASGVPLAVTAETSLSVAEADEDVLEAYRRSKAGKEKTVAEKGSEWDESIKVYHVEKLITDPKTGKREWLYWQEVEGGTVIDGTEAYSPYEVPTMYPAGLIAESGSDWYLPYALDYEGDHSAVETFAASLQDAAAAMAWFLFFVNPSGTTRIKDVQEADSLDVLSGSADDVTVLRTDKGGDMATVSNEYQEAARRLGFAYAMNSSIQRPGERVTREEWVQMASELNQTMGGLYADLAQGFQRWFVLRFIHLHQLEEPKLKALPEELISVGVVTGIENIGQDTDLTNLKGLVGDVAEFLGPEGVSQTFDPQGLVQRLAALRGVKAEGLIKTPEAREEDQRRGQEMQQQQTLLEQATGPIAKEGASALADMFKNQQGVNQNG